MSAMASKITSLRIVYPTVYSAADQRKHQSSASLAFVWGIHRWPVNSPHKGPVTRKMFQFDHVIMVSMDIATQWLFTSGSWCVLSQFGNWSQKMESCLNADRAQNRAFPIWSGTMHRIYSYDDYTTYYIISSSSLRGLVWSHSTYKILSGIFCRVCVEDQLNPLNHPLFGAVRFQVTSFTCDDCENVRTLCYNDMDNGSLLLIWGWWYHHQIRSDEPLSIV